VNAYLRIVDTPDTLDTEIELAGGWIAAGLATDPSDRRLWPSSTTGRVGHHLRAKPARRSSVEICHRRAVDGEAERRVLSVSVN
jgi:hypothetical protein